MTLRLAPWKLAHLASGADRWQASLQDYEATSPSAGQHAIMRARS